MIASDHGSAQLGPRLAHCAGMRPMADFDPSKPALLLDRLSEQVIGWPGALWAIRPP